MRLEEAFSLYGDGTKLKRKSRPEIKDGYTVEWLKNLAAWGKEDNRKEGYLIPQFMIDDAEADDWELAK